jgi:hypothetical protein
MKLDRQLRGPAGLRWLWKLLYGYGFWAGFGTALFMSPILMLILMLVVNGHIAPWDEQYKGFVLGDPLLAIVTGILASLVRRPTSTAYSPSKSYWYHWLGVGLLSSVMFIVYDLAVGKMHRISQLFGLHILYHHVILITVVVCSIGGMGYVQYKNHPRNKLTWVVAVLLICFLVLNAWDAIHPPVGMSP